MILRCRCGEQYDVEDKPVEFGETMECEECGSLISIPDLHGVISSDLVSSLQEEAERLREINIELKLRAVELEGKLAEVSEADPTEDPNKRL